MTASQKGNEQHSRERLGEIRYNKRGEKMKIIEYTNYSNILVEFETGEKIKSAYKEFKKGSIRNPSEFISRIGEVNNNFYDSQMTIIQYNNAKDVIVRFDNGFVTKTTYGYFKNGVVKNPYDKSIYGTGYIGEGEYIPYLKNQTPTDHYRKWSAMMERCYDKTTQEKRPTYKGCLVCDEWHNFQKFAKWYDKNYYEVDNEVMCLDKDILGI